MLKSHYFLSYPLSMLVNPVNINGSVFIKVRKSFIYAYKIILYDVQIYEQDLHKIAANLVFSRNSHASLI